MKSPFSWSAASLALAAASLFASPAAAGQWPDTPFTTSGRDILNACGEKVVFAGVNWPGHSETMLPEGLHNSSIADIVSKIKGLGMNIIRLTYAIEMIDDHFDNSPNQTLSGTLAKALGAENGATILNQILTHNPQFTAETTRLEVFDAVAEECANQELLIHLDNHVSKASWCCLQIDGNAWFGDKNFNVYNWTRGLGFMADRAQSWDAFASMSLRNELRPPINSPDSEPYDWPTWLKNVIPAAEGIHGNNSLPLIFFSGQNWDTTIAFAASGENDTGVSFTPDSYDFKDKIVFELHNYATGIACDSLTGGLYRGGYGAMNMSDGNFTNKAPVVLTEFGFDQGDGSDEGVYAQCIKDFLLNQPGGPGGWMQWALAGSYYIKFGSQNTNETWGVMNYDWSDYRNQTVVDTYIKPWVEATLA